MTSCAHLECGRSPGGVMVCVLTLSVVDLWWCTGSGLVVDTYGVMVCVLTLSVVDLWFDLWSSTKTPMVW